MDLLTTLTAFRLPSHLVLLLNLTLFVSPVVIYLLVFLVRRDVRRFPGTRAPFPLGHIQTWDDLLRANREILREHEKAPGQPISQFMFYRESVAVVEGDQVDAVFKSSVSRALEPPWLHVLGLYHIQKFMGAESVGVAEGEAWRGHRRAIGNSLRGNYIRSLYGEMVKCFEDVAAVIDKRGSSSSSSSSPVGVNEVCNALALDIVSLTVFKERFGSIRALTEGKPDETVEAFCFAAHEMARRVSSKNPLDFLYFPAVTQHRRRLQRAHHVIHESVREVITRRRLHHASSSKDGEQDDEDEREEDMITHLYQSHPSKETSSEIPKHVIDNVLTIMWAGHETSAMSLSASLYLLATHPLIQEELRRSLSAPVPPLEVNAIMSNPHLDAVCWETLRLHPPALWTNRGLMEEVYLPSKTGGKPILLEKGTQVFLPIWAIHRSKANWGEDAGEFKPFERFLGGSIPRNKAKLVPFGSGNRICPGNALAIFEFKTLLAHFVANYRVKMPSEEMRKGEVRFEAVGMFQTIVNNELVFERIN